MKIVISLLIIFSLFHISSFAQNEEVLNKKWLQNIWIDIGLNYRKDKYVLEYWSNHGTDFKIDTEIIHNAGMFTDINYRNRYFKISTGLTICPYSINYKDFPYKVINTSFSVGNNILPFFNKMWTEKWYFGPNVQLNYFFDRYPTLLFLGYGLNLYFKNYYMGFSKSFVKYYDGKKTYVFLSVAYSFNLNDFVRNKNR